MMTKTVIPKAGAGMMTFPVDNRSSELVSAARSALERSGHRSLACIECAVIDGIVVLSGRVPSYYLKQVAQNTVMRLGGGVRVENLVAVERQGEPVIGD
jgi:osmotically-inducible protein OsmY